jgi:hypothetical protein
MVVDRLRAAELYVELVANGRGVRLWDQALRQDIYLGDDAFIEQTQERARRRESTTSEIPKAQRSRPKLAPQSFGSGDARDESLRRAYVEGGMSMSEIAKAVGLSISRVSRLIARLEERLDQASHANRQVQPADSGSDTAQPDSVRAS